MNETAAIQPDSVQKILVLLLAPIGDTLFGTPALRALRQRYAGAEIAALVWNSNKEILVGNPHVDRLVVCRRYLELPRVMAQLQEEGFDLVVGLSNVGSWLTLFTGTQGKVGFNSQILGWAYSAPVPDRKDRHAAEYCLDVVRALGFGSQDWQELRLEIYLEESHRAFARRLLENAWGRQRRLRVAIHPGGRFFPAKRWTTEGFARVADFLARRYDAQVVIVGGPDDVELAAEITRAGQVAAPLVAAGQATLKQTAAIIEQCDLFVGNDSAPQHLAVAVGTPVVALFGPTDPRNFRPLGDQHVVVRKNLPCSPCFRWLGGSAQYLTALRTLECNSECMRSITPEDVVAAIEWQLDRLGIRQRLGLGPGLRLATYPARREPGLEAIDAVGAEETLVPEPVALESDAGNPEPDAKAAKVDSNIVRMFN